MSTHTPGPWKLTRGRRGTLSNSENWTSTITIQTDFHASGKITNGPEADIAAMNLDSRAAGLGGVRTFSHHIDADEAEANARLIAAAPELLDALGRLLHMAEEGSIPGPNTLNQARAAIAKAKGETP